MHDVNPLGLTMYLREIERQATTPRLLPVAAKPARGAGGLATAVTILLQLLRLPFGGRRMPAKAR